MTDTIERTDDAFSIAVDEIVFASIYEPLTFRHSDMPPQFGVTFPLAYLSPSDQQRWLRHPTRAKRPHEARAFSRRRPEVREINSRYTELSDKLSEADTRNLTRNRLFQGVPAVLFLQWFEWQLPTIGSGEGLSLIRIDVDVDSLRFPE